MDLIEVLPRLHMLRFRIGQAYLWHDRGDEGDTLTLIDAGSAGDADAVAAAVTRLGMRPRDIRLIVLTHCHPDHVGAAEEIAGWGGAAIAAHRADAPVIRGAAPVPKPVLLDWELPLYEHALTVPPAPPTRVDRELEDGEVLGFGGGALVVAAPGHTDGSIAVHLPEHGVLFTGDSVAGHEGGAMLGVFNTDRRQAIASFRRLAGLDVHTACFGHGDPLTRDAARLLRASADRDTGLEVEDGVPLPGA
jgi:glyoxylase-like metal-dependent hydrolase (beta-lactamase superfamily II)